MDLYGNYQQKLVNIDSNKTSENHKNKTSRDDQLFINSFNQQIMDDANKETLHSTKNEENHFSYLLNDKQKYEENLVLIEETYEDSKFLKLLDVKNQDGNCFLIFEKPQYTLLQYLTSIKEDIHSRFLLFKQSIEIVLKLVILKQKFDFFNYDIFFVVENNKDEIKKGDITPIKVGESEKFIKLKIYYHSNFFFLT